VSVGIKESLELVDLILVIAEAISESKKDGDLDWFDIPKFAPVILAARKAIQDSDKIQLELNDLSPDECKMIAMESLKAGQALVGAILMR
jgi:hypothetical protein